MTYDNSAGLAGWEVDEWMDGGGVAGGSTGGVMEYQTGLDMGGGV